MTHERRRNEEAEGGPEHDHSLPDATDIEVHRDPPDSHSPLIENDLED